MFNSFAENMNHFEFWILLLFLLNQYCYLTVSTKFKNVLKNGKNAPWANPQQAEAFTKTFIDSIRSSTQFTTQQKEDMESVLESLRTAIDKMRNSGKSSRTNQQALNTAFAISVAQIAFGEEGESDVSQKTAAITDAITKAFLQSGENNDDKFIREIMQLISMFTRITTLKENELIQDSTIEDQESNANYKTKSIENLGDNKYVDTDNTPQRLKSIAELSPTATEGGNSKLTNNKNKASYYRHRARIFSDTDEVYSEKYSPSRDYKQQDEAGVNSNTSVIKTETDFSVAVGADTEKAAIKKNGSLNSNGESLKLIGNLINPNVYNVANNYRPETNVDVDVGGENRNYPDNQEQKFKTKNGSLSVVAEGANDAKASDSANGFLRGYFSEYDVADDATALEVHNSNDYEQETRIDKKMHSRISNNAQRATKTTESVDDIRNYKYVNENVEDYKGIESMHDASSSPLITKQLESNLIIDRNKRDGSTIKREVEDEDRDMEDYGQNPRFELKSGTNVDINDDDITEGGESSNIGIYGADFRSPGRSINDADNYEQLLKTINAPDSEAQLSDGAVESGDHADVMNYKQKFGTEKEGTISAEEKVDSHTSETEYKPESSISENTKNAKGYHSYTSDLNRANSAAEVLSNGDTGDGQVSMDYEFLVESGAEEFAQSLKSSLLSSDKFTALFDSSTSAEAAQSNAVTIAMSATSSLGLDYASSQALIRNVFQAVSSLEQGVDSAAYAQAISNSITQTLINIGKVSTFKKSSEVEQNASPVASSSKSAFQTIPNQEQNSGTLLKHDSEVIETAGKSYAFEGKDEAAAENGYSDITDYKEKLVPTADMKPILYSPKADGYERDTTSVKENDYYGLDSVSDEDKTYPLKNNYKQGENIWVNDYEQNSGPVKQFVDTVKDGFDAFDVNDTKNDFDDVGNDRIQTEIMAEKKGSSNTGGHGDRNEAFISASRIINSDQGSDTIADSEKVTNYETEANLIPPSIAETGHIEDTFPSMKESGVETIINAKSNVNVLRTKSHYDKNNKKKQPRKRFRSRDYLNSNNNANKEKESIYSDADSFGLRPRKKVHRTTAMKKLNKKNGNFFRSWIKPKVGTANDDSSEIIHSKADNTAVKGAKARADYIDSKSPNIVKIREENNVGRHDFVTNPKIAFSDVGKIGYANIYDSETETGDETTNARINSYASIGSKASSTLDNNAAAGVDGLESKNDADVNSYKTLFNLDDHGLHSGVNSDVDFRRNEDNRNGASYGLILPATTKTMKNTDSSASTYGFRQNNYGINYRPRFPNFAYADGFGIRSVAGTGVSTGATANNGVSRSGNVVNYGRISKPAGNFQSAEGINIPLIGNGYSVGQGLRPGMVPGSIGATITRNTDIKSYDDAPTYQKFGVEMKPSNAESNEQAEAHRLGINTNYNAVVHKKGLVLDNYNGYGWKDSSISDASITATETNSNTEMDDKECTHKTQADNAFSDYENDNTALGASSIISETTNEKPNSLWNDDTSIGTDLINAEEKTKFNIAKKRDFFKNAHNHIESYGNSKILSGKSAVPVTSSNILSLASTVSSQFEKIKKSNFNYETFVKRLSFLLRQIQINRSNLSAISRFIEVLFETAVAFIQVLSQEETDPYSISSSATTFAKELREKFKAKPLNTQL